MSADADADADNAISSVRWKVHISGIDRWRALVAGVTMEYMVERTFERARMLILLGGLHLARAR